MLAAAAPAAARDAVVRSFDGTEIHVTLHRAAGLKAGERAPTILQTHGWAGSREKNAEAATDEATGNVGVGPLRKAGFNVLTWDSRGFGESGGTVTVDSKDFEGRDVQALLDWLADQPEATARRAERPARRACTASRTPAGSSWCRPRSTTGSRRSRRASRGTRC